MTRVVEEDEEECAARTVGVVVLGEGDHLRPCVWLPWMSVTRVPCREWDSQSVAGGVQAAFHTANQGGTKCW